MSDLAPFVAAVLRDKEIEELLEENRKLRSIVEKSQQLEITGPNGTPVYGYGSLEERVVSDSFKFWCVGIKASVSKLFRMNQLDGVRVTLGGITLTEFGARNQIMGELLDPDDIDVGDNENSKCCELRFMFYGSMKITVDFYTGPFTADECITMKSMNPQEFMEGLFVLYNQNPNKAMAPMGVVIEDQGIHTNPDSEFSEEEDSDGDDEGDENNLEME